MGYCSPCWFQECLESAGPAACLDPSVCTCEHVSAEFKAMLEEFMDDNDEALRRLAEGPK
jgi:hypothetical protein